MPRVVSIYLPDLPTDRIRRADPSLPAEQPIAVITRSGSRRWVAAADAAARNVGVKVGMPAAKAQALFRDLMRRRRLNRLVRIEAIVYRHD